MKQNISPSTQFEIRPLAVVMAICAACFQLSQPIEAQTSVWSGAAGDGLWSDAGNWSSGAPNGSGATADFSQLDITTNTSVTVSSDTIGSLIFGDANTNSAANWTLKSGTLTLDNGGPTPTITVGAMGGTNYATIGSALAGAAGFTKEGPGTLILSGANTFSGNITVQQGTLVFDASGSLGATTVNTVFTLGSSQGGSASLLLGGTATPAITNQIQLGASAVGTLTLGNYGSSAPEYSDGINLNGNNLTVLITNGSGTTYFTKAPISGSGNVTFDNNGPNTEIEVETSAGINNSGTITVQGTSTNASGPGFLISTIGTNVTGINYYTTNTPAEFIKITVGSAGLIVNSASTLTLTSGNLGSIGGVGSVTLNANNSGNLFPTFSGYTGMIENSGTGTGTTTIGSSLTSGGAATSVVQNSPTSLLVLSGANTYSGATTVSSGTMLINGSSGASSAVTVASGGILGGTGTIKGSLTVQAAGTLAPGTNDGFTIGTLTNSKNLTLNGNLFFKLNKSLTQSNDFVTGTAALTNLGTGTLTVTNVGPALVSGDTFYLFSQPLIGGNNLTIVGPATFINNLAVNGSIQVSGSAPPPSVSSLVPDTGRTNGGTLIAINGSSFVSGATVQFGATTPITATFVSSSQLTVTTPAQVPGTVTVTVKNPDTQTAASPYTYILPPPKAAISSLVNAAGTLTMIWQGGTNQNCVLLTSTNAAAPISQWTPVANETNAVGANGLCTNCITITPGKPVQFYLLSIPYN